MKSKILIFIASFLVSCVAFVFLRLISGNTFCIVLFCLLITGTLLFTLIKKYEPDPAITDPWEQFRLDLVKRAVDTSFLLVASYLLVLAIAVVMYFI